jgi:hypothetical protein
MKLNWIILTIAFVFLIGSQSSFAGDEYRCKIIQAQQLTDTGKLKEAMLVKPGEKFSVERATGEIAGDFIPNGWPGWPSRMELIDVGSNHDGFKVVYITPPTPHSHVMTLFIEHYVENEEKPFVLTLDDEVNVGTCVRTDQQDPRIVLNSATKRMQPQQIMLGRRTDVK